MVTIEMVKQWIKEQVAEYQKTNRIKLNGYDPFDLAQKYNEAIADAERYRWLRDNKHLDIWWSVDGPEDRCENIDADVDEAMLGMRTQDLRPTDCRERLQAEGQAYPKSGCNACKKNVFQACPHEHKQLGQQ